MYNFKQYFLIICLLLITSLVRVWHIESNPAWYTDEGTHIEIARHLLDGNIQYLGITDSYMIAARLPLFENLLALWFRCVGVGMFQLRILTSLLGIITVALVYRVVKIATHDSLFALSTLTLLAIYPQAVIYSRFGFSYNLLPILVLSGLWCLVRYHQTRKLYYLLTGGFLFGLGTLSDFISFSFLPSVVLIVVFIRPKYVILTLVILLTPFALFSIIEIVQQPDIFIHDLTYTLSRTGGLPLTVQLENLLKNFQILLTETWWMPLGIMGCLFITPRYFRWIVIIMLILPIMISGRTIALYNLSAYYMIPFLPFVPIGISALLIFVAKLFNVLLPSKKEHILTCLLAIIFITSFSNLWSGIQSGFVLGIEQFLIDKYEANQLQQFLIDYTKSPDIIISSPTLAWVFDAHVTDYQLSSLSSQVDGVHFPATLYPERFAFDVNYRNATYAIVDNLWRDWGVIHMPIVNDMLTDIQQNWELIYQSVTLQVYKNPQT